MKTEPIPEGRVRIRHSAEVVPSSLNDVTPRKKCNQVLPVSSDDMRLGARKLDGLSINQSYSSKEDSVRAHGCARMRLPKGRRGGTSDGGAV